MTIRTGETLILGGTGKTGSRVARRLAERGIGVRVASRAGQTRFDWDDDRTWPAAVRGATAAYLVYAPDLAAPGAADQVRRFTRLAVDHGVERLVLLAGRGEPQVAPAEHAVRESGVAFTILECAFFCQNFSEGMLAPEAGAIVFPAGDVPEPFVDADDIADVAVAALTDSRHHGETYDVTGPGLVTFAGAAATIAAAAGRPIEYVPVSFDDYAGALAAHMAPDHVTFFIELFRSLLDGHNAHLGDGVERALGRKPRDFATYAREAAARGAWTRGR